MSYTLSDIAQDYMFCELCDNYVPRDYCEKCQEFTCEYCLAEYGCGDFPLHP